MLWDRVCRHRFFTHVDVRVEYEGRDGELKLGGVVAGWKAVVDLARSAVYQGGITHLQIKQAFAFGTSAVRLIVRRVSMYSVLMAATDAPTRVMYRHSVITTMTLSD